MTSDVALLLVRLVVGGLLAGHGAQKLFGWFGGPGLARTRTLMGGVLGFRPAGLWALLAGLTEFGGGLLVALGLLTPLGALGIVGAMLVASATHWPKVWAMERGFEYPLVLLTVAAAVGLLGPGALSLDAALALALPSQTLFLLGLVPTLVGVAVALATRAPSQAPAAPAAQTSS